MRFKRGDLVYLINGDGEIEGVVIYMDTHPPGSLPIEAELEHSTWWNYSIIDQSGRLRYIDTTNWTLTPADG